MAQPSEPERPSPAAASEALPEAASASPPEAPAPPPPAAPRRPAWRRLLPWGLAALLAGALVLLVLEELSESRLQARVFSAITARLSYSVEPGPSPAIRFPGDGPYDQRLGYHQLPAWSEALRQQGYAIEAQARWSPGALDLAELGLFTIAREKDQAGLAVADCSGQALHQARFPQRGWARFEDLPPLLVDALLFIENRELLDADRPRMNPAIEWLRLGKAVGEQALRLIGDEGRAPGGSTLATQMEKYRHSPDGRTDGAGEKLRQMVSATLRAYRDGPETMARRREIVRGYLNTVPLAARPGWGEVNGIGDGLWAWFGQDFDTANRLLRETGPLEDAAQRLRRARVVKQALALMVAQRRPSYYLGAAQEKALGELTDSYLRVMAEAGVIPATLRDDALATTLQRLPSAPRELAPPFSERKAATALRARLQGLLAIPRAYELDRLDLQVASTLDAELQAAVTRRLRSLRDAEAARAAGLYGFRLLQPEDDPQHLQFSFTLFELGPQANRLRVQTDNVDQPFDINDGARLDLGSTAKLRTLVSYLELVAELHERWQGLDAAALRALRLPAQDLLGRWAREHLLATSDRSRAAMLEAAMQRSYSASPYESFFTGGGLHTFANFDKEDDARVLTVRESLRRSVNLPFVRMMREVVRHLVAQGPGAALLDEPEAPPPLPRGADAAAREAAATQARQAQEAREALRRTYLARYADREGREYLARFHPRYQGLDAAKVEERLLQSLGQPGAERLAAVWSVLEPQADASALAAFLARTLPGGALPPPAQLQKLWQRYFSPESARSLPLEDRALVARIHPLELWTAARLRRQSGARLSELIAASDAERQGASAWLLRTRHRAAQDQRIRQMLEAEGFEALHRRWQRLGYPFETLTPSYASALGASGDRPAALAELMGILVNQGRRLPVARIERLAFAVDTPYETRFALQPRQAEAVLDPEVARIARGALIEVVEGGTAGRLRGSLLDADGKPIAIGGKTGTGDHRYEVYGRGGALLSSRVVSRSGTFVFLIGERWFGTMMVYASAPHAEGYTFTSALPTQVLKSLMPTLQPLLRSGLCHAEPEGPEASLVAGPR